MYIVLNLTNNGAVPTSNSLLSYGSSDSCRSTFPPSIRAALTNGILVLNNAAFTANDTASQRLPPHSKIWIFIDIYDMLKAFIYLFEDLSRNRYNIIVYVII